LAATTSFSRAGKVTWGRLDPDSRLRTMASIRPGQHPRDGGTESAAPLSALNSALNSQNTAGVSDDPRDSQPPERWPGQEHHSAALAL
jgi:hypothetical protein